MLDNEHKSLLIAATELLMWLREFYPDEPLFSDDPQLANSQIVKRQRCIEASSLTEWATWIRRYSR